MGQNLLALGAAPAARARSTARSQRLKGGAGNLGLTTHSPLTHHSR